VCPGGIRVGCTHDGHMLPARTNQMIISDYELANSAFQYASSSNPRRSTWPKVNKEAIGSPRNPKRRKSKSLPQHQAKRVRDGSRPSLRAKGNRNGWRHLAHSKHAEGSILPAIFEFLYREYCRARLVEMRKQLFLTNSPETPEADGKVGRSDGANDRDSGLDDSQCEDGHPRPS
jgi:hypothetical protein